MFGSSSAFFVCFHDTPSANAYNGISFSVTFNGTMLPLVTSYVCTKLKYKFRCTLLYHKYYPYITCMLPQIDSLSYTGVSYAVYL